MELEQAGHQVDYWFVETVSGTTQRPEFNKMLDKLRKGDTLVVSKLDRLRCDAADVLATIKRLGELGVEVQVLQLGKQDWASPVGKLMLAAVAEMERACTEGKTLGRPSKTTPKVGEAIAVAHQDGASINALGAAIRRFQGDRT